MPKLFDLIPESALALHTGIMGKTRSGKTNTGKVIVEGLVAEGYRVCILDPIKSDWWGITSSSDGKRPGLPFQILGGPHGHVQLHGSAGAAVGELVAGGDLPLSVIDMAYLGAKEFNPFYHSFAETLFKKKKKQDGVLYLVIEEAHEFAPKERAGLDGENMSLYWTKKLATGAGSLGIRLIVCTQAVQQLSNRVFGSLDTIIAHRMTAPADIEPTMKWFRQNASKETSKLIEDSIPKLTKGDSWIYASAMDERKRVQWPLCKTFDNASTPTKDGSGSHDVTMARVDTDALRQLLGEAVAEVEANDPKKLKEKVAKLEAELEAARTPTDLPPPVDMAEQEKAIEALNVNLNAYQTDNETVRSQNTELRTQLERAKEIIAADKEDFAATQSTITRLMSELAERMGRGDLPFTEIKPLAPAPARAVQTVAHKVDRSILSMNSGPARQANTPSEGLTGPENAIMNALSFWSQAGDRQPMRAAVAIVAEYSPSSTSFTKAMGSLRVKGLIEYPTSETLAFTDKGRGVAPRSDQRMGLRDFHERLLGMLPGPEASVLRPLLKHYPRAMTRESCAAEAGYTVKSTSFTKAAGALRSRGFIDYPDPAAFVALQVLFPKLRSVA